VSEALVNQFLAESDFEKRDLKSARAVNAMQRFLNENMGRTSDGGGMMRLRRFKVRVLIAAGYSKNAYGFLVLKGGSHE